MSRTLILGISLTVGMFQTPILGMSRILTLGIPWTPILRMSRTRPLGCLGPDPKDAPDPNPWDPGPLGYPGP